MSNPLLTDWETPFGLPPFAEISDADFEPAFDAALGEARAEIAAIAGTADLTLATRNTKDFLNISGLELVNPWELG